MDVWPLFFWGPPMLHDWSGPQEIRGKQGGGSRSLLSGSCSRRCINSSLKPSDADCWVTFAQELRTRPPPTVGSKQKRPGAKGPPEFAPESPSKRGVFGSHIFSKESEGKGTLKICEFWGRHSGGHLLGRPLFLLPIQGSKSPNREKVVLGSKNSRFPIASEKGDLSQRKTFSLWSPVATRRFCDSKRPFLSCWEMGVFLTPEPSFPGFGDFDPCKGRTRWQHKNPLKGSKGHTQKGRTLKTPWNSLRIPWKHPEDFLKFMTFTTFSLCPLWACPLHLSKPHKHILEDAAFLLTVGSFLLTVERFYLQSTILAFLPTAGSFCLQL